MYGATLNSGPQFSNFRMQVMGQLEGALFMNKTRRFFGEGVIEVYSGNREASLKIGRLAAVSVPQCIPYRSA